MWQVSARRKGVPRALAVVLTTIICLIGCGLVARISYSLPPDNGNYRELLGLGLGNRGVAVDTFGRAFLNSLAGFDYNYLPGILERGLPGGDSIAAVTTAAGGQVDNPESTPLQAEIKPGPNGADVVIYHTHNAETYLPSAGTSKVDGKNGGVAQVGNEMQRILNGYGYSVIHDLTIHDYPDFPTSYIKSEVTAEKLVQQNPHLKVLIDLHRDAGVPRRETVQVDGEPVAKVMLIVGNGQGLPNSHWRDNYTFAQEIGRKLNEKYPGVLKAVQLKNGRFNQHLSPHAILIEAGSDKNSLEEAERAGRCVANVLAEMIRNGD